MRTPVLITILTVRTRNTPLREFLIEDLAYSQALSGFSYVSGVGPADYDKPRANLTGDPYYTDGRRAVMWLSEKPTPISDIKNVDMSSQ